MVKDGFRPTEKNYIGVDELNPHPAYLPILFFSKSRAVFTIKLNWRLIVNEK